MKANSLSKETVQKLISDLDTQIKQAEGRLDELKRMKDELETHLGNGSGDSTDTKSPVRRLPAGLPKKLVREVLQKHRRLSIGEIMHLIKEERGYKVKDGSTRRALDSLRESGLIVKEEDGTYRWAEGELV